VAGPDQALKERGSNTPLSIRIAKVQRAAILCSAPVKRRAACSLFRCDQGSWPSRARELNIVVGVQVEPKVSRRAERLAEPKRRIGGNPVFSAAIRSMRLRGSPHEGARRDIERDRNSSRRTSPGCRGLSFLVFGRFSLVIIHDLDLTGPYGNSCRAWHHIGRAGPERDDARDTSGHQLIALSP
jgi:hypothetical protein